MKQLLTKILLIVLLIEYGVSNNVKAPKQEINIPVCSKDDLSFANDTRYFKIGFTDSYPSILVDSKTIQIDKKKKIIKVLMIWIANKNEQKKFKKDFGSKYKNFGYFKRLIAINYSKKNYKVIHVSDFNCNGKTIISFDFKDVKWKKIPSNGKIEKITKTLLKKYDLK